jgi:hypothetical protein
MEDCSRAQIECESCRNKLHPTENQTHECVGRLKIKVKSLEDDVKRLKLRADEDIISKMVDCMDNDALTDNYFRTFDSLGLSSPEDLVAVMDEELRTCTGETGGATFERVQKIAMLMIYNKLGKRV